MTIDRWILIASVQPVEIIRGPIYTMYLKRRRLYHQCYLRGITYIIINSLWQKYAKL